MNGIFFEITIVICLVAILTVTLRLLKQPAILAYILTGIILGPFGQLQFHNQEAIRTFGEFGITLLLFMLGLELKLKDIKSIGKIALVAGINQIVVTGTIAYFISILLGFSSMNSFYISICLTLSSTIVIVKLLSDKRELATLYGKILIGILLVQDFFAIGVLMFLSGFQNPSETIGPASFLAVFIKAVLLFLLLAFLGKNIFPRLIHMLARSHEALFLVSLAWVFGLAAIVSSPLIGFSIEIGGFLAGISLANSVENLQIVARVKSLRDFFITLFFVMLGMGMNFNSLDKILWPLIIFIVFVLILKPLIIAFIVGLIGYKKKTSYLTGVHANQISEFSFVVVFLGTRLGQITPEVSAIITGVGIVTFVFSSYTVFNTDLIYKLINPHFSFFEKKSSRKEEFGHSEKELGDFNDHVVLIGANRMGQSILDALVDLKNKVIVVDFDPSIVSGLKEKNVPVIFGDVSDAEIQGQVRINKAKLVISTAPNLNDNMVLIKGITDVNKKAKIIVVGEDLEHAKELYMAGADYVILPELTGGMHIVEILKEGSMKEMIKLKKRIIG